MSTKGKLVHDRIRAIEGSLVVDLPSKVPVTQMNIRNSPNNKNIEKLALKPARKAPQIAYVSATPAPAPSAPRTLSRPPVPAKPTLATTAPKIPSRPSVPSTLATTPLETVLAFKTVEEAKPLIITDKQAILETAAIRTLIPCHSAAVVADRMMAPPSKVSSPTSTWDKIRGNVSTVSCRIRSSSTVAVIRGNVSSISTRFEKKMQTVKRKIIYSIFGMLFLLFLYKNTEVTEPAELDEYFYSLNYSPDELLIYQGERISEIPNGQILNGSRCIRIKRRKLTMKTSTSEFGVEPSNQHNTFPGYLLLANSRLVNSSPDVLAVDRAPLTYTVNFQGLAKRSSFKIVPSFSEYQAELNKVLNTWFEDCPNCSVAADFHSVDSFAYSKQFLRVKFGLDFIISRIESGINFNIMDKADKLIKVYKFTQKFYTVSVEPPKTPSDLFNSTVTLSQIKRKTDKNNPPVLVDSVSYGRSIYLKIESSSKEKYADLELTIKGFKPALQNANDLKDLDIEMFVIGGTTNHTKITHFTSIDQVHEVIKNFSEPSRNNVGFPIFYSLQFIKNNQKAVVHLATDYVESVYDDMKCKNESS